ncbi:hypothetical protein B0H14DRAFT_3041068 [Mycena olivaceomarginata]|nr:hypothetical protein B0H14DRAFT_3041068 [Mycena olivaceomarginata]
MLLSPRNLAILALGLSIFSLITRKHATEWYQIVLLICFAIGAITAAFNSWRSWRVYKTQQTQLPYHAMEDPTVPLMR